MPDKPPLDLDALEREDRPGPFTVQLGGQTYTLADPMEMEWRELAALSTFAEPDVMDRLLGDDYERFREHQMPAWKYKRLVRAWRTHYGLPDLGESLASSE